MAETRPTGEQLRFISSATGDHILDTYLENAEKGGRTLPDLLSDLFENNGDFAADNFQFRIEDTTRKYQVRVGVFANNSTGWLDIPNGFVFRQRGTYTNATAYEQLDVVTVNNSTFICTVAHTSSTATPDATKFAVVLDGTALNTATASAAASASAAATSATNSANSATAAASSQSAAATSATSASNSATSASTSAATATTQASNSATSAAASAASASAASASQSAAAASQSAAAASASAASASQSAAATSASNAATSASSASSSASSASASAATATTQATNSAASAALANDWATKTSSPVAGGEYSAKYHAQQANTSATNAASSASAAASSASSASSAQTAAEAARDATLAAYDSFDDRYLGAKASDPTLDNDGNALVAGALYFNTTTGAMKLYNGTAWVAAYISGAGVLLSANNLSDLTSVTSARTNLGLGSAALSSTSDFAPASHTHTIAQITSLQTTLDGKAPLTGTGTSGTWPISITGNAATATTSSQLGGISSNRAILKRRSRIHSTDGTSLNSSITAPEMGFTYGGSGEPTGPFITFGGLGGDIDYSCQFVGSYNGGGNDFKIRTRNDDSSAWNPWRTLLTDGNYNSYSPTLTGGGASGTWSISINGDNNKTAPMFGYAVSGQNTSYGGAIGPMVNGQGGGAAGISFHRPNAYGLNMGLDSDNVFRIGGWSASSERLYLNMSGDLVTPGSMRSPIFYDTNNTGYYVDPTATARLATVHGDYLYSGGDIRAQSYIYAVGRVVVGEGQGDSWIEMRDTNEGTRYIHNNSGTIGFVGSHGSWRFRMADDGNLIMGTYQDWMSSQIRSAIFYDHNDTGWYCDPNGTSRLNQLYLNTGTWHYSAEGWNRLLFDSSGATHLRGIWGDAWWLRFGWQNNDTGVIFEGSGNIYAQGNVTAYWSDRRLKTNLRKISNWREIMDGLNGYFYEWNEKGQRVFSVLSDEEKQTRVGLIAQEVKAVLPQAATIQELQFKNGKHEPRDDIADIVDLDDPFLTVREEKLIPVLVEAIKGLMAEVDELKAKMELR